MFLFELLNNGPVKLLVDYEGKEVDEMEDLLKMSEKNIHWSRIKEVATPGQYRRPWSNRQWREEMLACTEIAVERQGSNA